MADFWFYIQLGFDHVLDFNAYDHILFLAALAIPFAFKDWKKVIVLATIFTVAHCTSLALSVFKVVSVDVALIEFLIPVTIAATAVINIYNTLRKQRQARIGAIALATTFFGLIHGFGFSNYFNMLMAEEDEKVIPLLGFATGIELSQVTIILGVLLLGFLVQSLLRVKTKDYVLAASILIVGITIPMLINTFPS